MEEHVIFEGDASNCYTLTDACYGHLIAIEASEYPTQTTFVTYVLTIGKNLYI